MTTKHFLTSERVPLVALAEPAPYAVVIRKVETAIKALEDLMLDDGWDALDPS